MFQPNFTFTAIHVEILHLVSNQDFDTLCSSILTNQVSIRTGRKYANRFVVGCCKRYHNLALTAEAELVIWSMCTATDIYALIGHPYLGLCTLLPR
jgi:hypothetical protein